MRSDQRAPSAARRTHRLLASLAIAGASLVAISHEACAQQAAPTAPAANIVTVNPVFLPLGAVVVEYERAVAPGATLGLSAGYYDAFGDGSDSDERYSSGEVKFRYYPNERAPRGLSVGVTAGVASYTDDDACCSDDGRGRRESDTAPTVGVVLDYNWLLGRSRRFVVGTGVGAKRLLGERPEADFFDVRVLPLVRLQVGAAF